MLKISIYFAGLFMLFGVMAGCHREHEYDRRVREELAKGERHDSLFMGLYLGMVERDFYGHCWELNKKGLIRQGSGNTTVLYKLKELKRPAEMNFYPSFYNKKIWQMPVKFNYESWAPWNKNLMSDSLELDVLRLFKNWYGDDFLEVKHRKFGSAFVKIDGNRRITIYKIDDQYVMALFTDLLVENLMKAEAVKEGAGDKTKK
jgi:hypothetical protein